MKISEMLVLTLISFGILTGMLTFMGDLSQTYTGLEVPADLYNKTENYARSVNDTATSIMETTQNEGGWTETIYNIFFKLPASLISTATGSLDTIMSFFGIVIGESGAIVPNWFIIMIAVIIVIIFAFAGIYFITGRNI